MYLLGDDQRNTYLFHIKILCPALVQKRNWVIITQQPRLKILSVIYVLVPSPPLKRGCKHWNSCPLPNDTQTVLLVLLLPPSSSVHHVRFFHARFRSLQVATTLQFANTVFWPSHSSSLLLRDLRCWIRRRPKLFVWWSQFGKIISIQKVNQLSALKLNHFLTLQFLPAHKETPENKREWEEDDARGPSFHCFNQAWLDWETSSGLKIAFLFLVG